MGLLDRLTEPLNDPEVSQQPGASAPKPVTPVQSFQPPMPQEETLQRNRALGVKPVQPRQAERVIAQTNQGGLAPLPSQQRATELFGGPSANHTGRRWETSSHTPQARLMPYGTILLETKKIATSHRETADLFDHGIMTNKLLFALDQREGSTAPSSQHFKGFNKFRFAQVWMSEQPRRLMENPLTPEQVYGQMKELGFGELVEDGNGNFNEAAYFQFLTQSARDIQDWKQSVRDQPSEQNTSPGGLSTMPDESIHSYGTRLAEIAGRPVVGRSSAEIRRGDAGLTSEDLQRERNRTSGWNQAPGETMAEYGARVWVHPDDPSGGLN